MNKRRWACAGAVWAAGVGAGCGAAAGQSTNVVATHPHGWCENIGWSDWRNANGGAQGVHVCAHFLSGFVWQENAGWINLGDGTPTSGYQYANLNDTDFGVNIDPATGNLSGLGWGENIGWVQFDTAASLTAFGQQARYDKTAKRLRGYAWCQDTGWINLDDGTEYVAACIADYDNNGTLTVGDIFAFLSSWFSGSACTDVDGTPGRTVADIFAFLSIWFGGCPS